MIVVIIKLIIIIKEKPDLKYFNKKMVLRT
jgi:hypothetical protein